MATRLYFGIGSAPIAPSSWSSGWNKTTPGTSPAERALTFAKSAFSDLEVPSTTASGTSGHFTVIRRFVSDPLAQQTISGTLKGQVACHEAAAGDNFTLAVAAKVIQPGGTDRGVLLAVSASDNTAATPPEMATTATNRRMLDAAESASLTLSSVDAQLGDRIVIEIGFRQASTSTGAGNATFRSEAADLGENDTDASTLSPWVEFSQNLEFAAAYFGTVSTPADSSSAANTADPTAVTPPTGMVAGDLVLMIGQQRAASATLAISQAGGQSWTPETAISTTNQTARLFWCVFDGTWTANPSVDFSAAVCNSVHMHVFRTGGSDWTWSVNQALVELDKAAAPHTITGQTTTGTSVTVTVAGWFTADDNEWGTLSGTGWQTLGFLNSTGRSQYRNTSGSDQSATYAYKTQSSAGATGNVTKTQAALGDDASTTFIITFEVAEAGLSLEPSLYTETDTFFAPTVSPGAVAITPSLYTETDTFFTQTVVSTYALTPALFTESDAFHAPTVTPGAVNLTPSLFTETDAFFVPTVTPGAVNVTPSLFTESDTYFTHEVTTGGASQDLTPSLFTETDTFHTPTVTATYALTAALYTETDTFHALTVTSTNGLVAALFAESDTFFAPTVAAGAVNLTPALYAETDTFHTPTVTTGAVNVSPSLYSETDTFFGPVVQLEGGDQHLSANLFTDTDTFHTPTVTAGAVNLAPALYSESDTFFTHAVAAGAVNVSPSLYSEADAFFTHVVSAGANDLVAAHFAEVDTFPTHTVTAGAINLTPALFNEGDAFFLPTVESGLSLSPALYSEADAFFSPVVAATYALTAALFVDTDTFHGAILGDGLEQPLVPAKFTEEDVFYGASIDVSYWIQRRGAAAVPRRKVLAATGRRAGGAATPR